MTELRGTPKSSTLKARRRHRRAEAALGRSAEAEGLPRSMTLRDHAAHPSFRQGLEASPELVEGCASPLVLWRFYCTI
jgi:hypothetical protein